MVVKADLAIEAMTMFTITVLESAKLSIGTVTELVVSVRETAEP